MPRHPDDDSHGPDSLPNDLSAGASRGQHAYYDGTVFPTLAFLGTVLVLVFIVCQVYRRRNNKPRRKRVRLRRVQQVTTFGGKVPGV